MDGFRRKGGRKNYAVLLIWKNEKREFFKDKNWNQFENYLRSEKFS